MVDLGIDRIIDGLAGNLDGLFGKATSGVRDQFAGVDFGGTGGGDSLALPQATLTDPFARVRFGMPGSGDGGTTGGTSAFPNPFAGFDRALQRVRDGQAQAATQRTGPADEYTNGDGSTDAFGATEPYTDIYRKAAAQYADINQDELVEVARALTYLESRGVASAQGVVVTEGPYAGQRAQGLMQVMPGNAPGVNLLDPQANITHGMRILTDAYRQYGDWDRADAAYFGAIKNGQITGAKDDNGTDGYTYVNQVQQYRQQVRSGKAPAALPNGGSVVAAAAKYLGTPYGLGGRRAGNGTIDCSELTAAAFEAVGVKLPWNAWAQAQATQRISASQLQEGDLVFFKGTDPNNSQPVTHVGIYAGNGRMINAQDGGTMYADLNSQYWRDHLWGYGRVQR